MVVKHLGDNQYQGLAADTKPTPANTAVTAVFRETDTDNEYTNNGSAWVQTDLDAYSYIIYKQGSTYYAKSKNLTNYSNTNCRLMLQTITDAIPTNGSLKLFFKNGTYDIDNQSTTNGWIIAETTNGPTKFVHVEGESRDGVILRNTYAALVQIPTYVTILCHAHSLWENITFDGNTLGVDGSVRPSRVLRQRGIRRGKKL